MLIAAPPIDVHHIDMNARRRAEMRAYSKRHYGYASARLHPKVIVEHMTANTSFRATFNTFASDAPDPELHERPGTCSHFVVDKDGTIHQLVPLGLMCRHTVGLNWTAIGIEHVGLSDSQVMGDRPQLRACAGKQFDPAVVEALCAVVERQGVPTVTPLRLAA